MSEKPIHIQWNEDFESYEALYSDGYILPLRDSIVAEELAKEFGIEVEG